MIPFLSTLIRLQGLLPSSMYDLEEVKAQCLPLCSLGSVDRNMEAGPGEVWQWIPRLLFWAYGQRKGGKLRLKWKPDALVKLTFGTLRRKCVSYYSPATHTLGDSMRMSWGYSMVRQREQSVDIQDCPPVLHSLDRKFCSGWN